MEIIFSVFYFNIFRNDFSKKILMRPFLCQEQEKS